jgi:ATP-dependent DNA helicase RecG
VTWTIQQIFDELIELDEQQRIEAKQGSSIGPSVLRNPIIANVLYDLEFAETKGTGFRTMKRLLKQAGLTNPILVSSRESNAFTAKFLLHQFMDEPQLTWLQQFKTLGLGDDEAKALILSKEMGAIDNAALRTITHLDTLAASKLLRRLWQQHHLLEKGGSGRSTYYRLASSLRVERDKSDLDSNRGDLDSNRGDLPQTLQEAITSLSPKARASVIRPIILNVCLAKTCSADEMASLLKRDVKALKKKHLAPMRENNLLAYSHPEVINHPHQAYVITEKGKEVLKKGKIVTASPVQPSEHEESRQA